MLRITVVLAAFSVSAVVLAAGPMKCYQCNSAVDTKCESSDVSDLKSFIKQCSSIKEGTFAKKPATACRKVVQNVESGRSIIRECAYSGDVDMDGMRKQGNKGVKLFHYQCLNADNSEPCNGASALLSSALLTVVSAAALLTRF